MTRGARVSYSRTGTGPAVLMIQGVGAVGDVAVEELAQAGGESVAVRSACGSGADHRERRSRSALSFGERA